MSKPLEMSVPIDLAVLIYAAKRSLGSDTLSVNNAPGTHALTRHMLSQSDMARSIRHGTRSQLNAACYPASHAGARNRVVHPPRDQQTGRSSHMYMFGISFTPVLHRCSHSGVRAGCWGYIPSRGSGHRPTDQLCAPTVRICRAFSGVAV